MRFAFVTTDLTVGGAQTWLINTSRLLLDQGHEVHIFLYSEIIRVDLDVRVNLHFLSFGRQVWGNKLSKILASSRLSNKIRKLGPFNLIISTLPFADQITHTSRVGPSCFRIANNLSNEIDALKGPKGKRRMRRYLKLYSGKKIISVSEGVKNDLVKNFGLEIENITTIYNQIDKDRLRELADKYEPFIKEPYLLHSGRFAFQKRHDILLDAFKLYLMQAKLDDPKKLVLICESSQKLEEMIKKRKLDEAVIVAGFHENPFPWYKNSSCIVLSSDREGMPNILLEGLALGVPIASTDCPSGPNEILGDRYSEFLAPTGNPKQLALSILKALHSREAIPESILNPFLPSETLRKINDLCKEVD